MIFKRGMRDKISNYADPSGELVVDMSISGNSVYDFTCFGVDSADKLSDDRYIIRRHHLRERYVIRRRKTPRDL